MSTHQQAVRHGNPCTKGAEFLHALVAGAMTLALLYLFVVLVFTFGCPKA